MNAKLAAKRESPATDELWTVRGEDGATFGPATLASLQAWARDGRLAPTHRISANGSDWIAAPQLPALAMDWIVEVAPGTFYGPIHRQALDELIRDGALQPDACRFNRAVPEAAAAAAAREAEQAALAGQLAALRDRFGRSSAELEGQARQLTAECDQLRGELAAKDLELEAERQELRAAVTRLQAELAKSRAAGVALEKQVAQGERRDQELTAARTRLAECEARLAQEDTQARTSQAALEARLVEAQQAQRESERVLLAERAAQADQARELKRLAEAVGTLRRRQDSARQLLRQAGELIADDAARGGVVIEDGLAVAEPEGTPPPRGPISLDQLEAQARREIHRLSQQGGSVFGKRR